MFLRFVCSELASEFAQQAESWGVASRSAGTGPFWGADSMSDARPGFNVSSCQCTLSLLSHGSQINHWSQCIQKSRQNDSACPFGSQGVQWSVAPDNLDLHQFKRQTEGWEKSCECIQLALDTQGPFDGCLGFSQVRN